MTYQVLCDENVEPGTVGELESKGVTATHVNNRPGQGSDDEEVAAYARENDYLVLTNDADFLDATAYPDLKVLYVPENRTPAHELARRVLELTRLVPNPEDLPREVFLTDHLF